MKSPNTAKTKTTVHTDKQMKVADGNVKVEGIDHDDTEQEG
jgi:hypothetical protein